VVVVGDGESSPGWPLADPRDRHKERRDQGYRCSGGARLAVGGGEQVLAEIALDDLGWPPLRLRA
jgi:hypothetical protein